MATFANPSSYKGPYDFDKSWEENAAAEEAWLEELKAELQAKYKGDIVGEQIRWQVADGFACYIVVQQKPLKVAQLDVGDGWNVDPILIRGLNVEDVRAMVERERALARLFARA